MSHFSLRALVSRRTVLRAGAAGAAVLALPALAQPGRGDAAALAVAQLYDRRTSQQDVSKDFIIGSRAAWQVINSKGGVRGRRVEHRTIEADDAAGSIEAAVAQVIDDPACVVLSGSAGDALATDAVRLLARAANPVAHIAPWLQDSSLEIDDRTFPIFAARQEQIAHAVVSLSAMGLKEAGVVFASPVEYKLYRAELVRSATESKLAVKEFTNQGDLAALGRSMGPTTPALLLFVGGTPELARFTQGLESLARQRWVVALADVNLQTLQQMTTIRRTSIIVTQAVPMVSASQPVVRSYRETMARLFDEPPTTLGLAGFLAARYTHEVLQGIDGAVNRQSALAAFRKRATVELGGFRVVFDNRRRSAQFVTLSMLASDGRVVG